MTEWQDAQIHEMAWWGKMTNTYGEEEKQTIYAARMGLRWYHDGKSPWNIDMKGKSVLDIGGGPTSLLLKCVNLGPSAVIEPMPMPQWSLDRYKAAGISVIATKAEDLKTEGTADEVWLYNVLQHVEDPQKVIEAARRCGDLVRAFEWLDIPTCKGHLHTFHGGELNEWFGGQGTVEKLNEAGCNGKAWYGVFPKAGCATRLARRVYRFHSPGLVHLPISRTYMGCAFTQKIVKLTEMLMSLGHEVILYGAEGSDVPCTEFVRTHDLFDIRNAWGDTATLEKGELGYDWRNGEFRHDFNAPRKDVTKLFYKKCIEEMNRRKRPDDILLMHQGVYHRPISDGVQLWLNVEPGVGYHGSYGRSGMDPKTNKPVGPYRGWDDWGHRRAFESAALQNFTYGSESPGKCVDGDWYDRVIPNYFDPRDFTFQGKKEDYFLYIGRMIQRKGVNVAVEATRAIGAKLILAGQQDPEIDVGKLPAHCEYIGYLDPERRSEMMGKARAVFVPTIYLESFGGVNVEAQLCGTPVITTAFSVFPETVAHGMSGFCCNTLQDFVDAARLVDTLDYAAIRARAERYLMENVKYEFQQWFDDLYQLFLSAQDSSIAGWAHLRARE